jgi:tetratricopeptide (TPR) repeat protein
MTGRAAARVSGLLAALLLWVCAPAPARAQASDEALREAASRFQRGVTLYSQGDYQGALLEFRRAYEITPNGSVLYNIAETEYQLRDYASALTTFERYLVEAGNTDAHRVEVETNIIELRSHVGRLTINTIPRGAEVSVDDRVVGKTPFDSPVVVGVGHVRVTATMPGRTPASREVEVAAQDDLTVLLQLAPLPLAKAAPPHAPAVTLVDAAPARAGGGSSLRSAGWITAGVLGAGAIAMGLLAIHEGATLKSERDAYQDDMSAQYASDKRSRLDQLSSRTRTYSLLGDSLGAAAVVVGAITLMSGGKRGSERAAAATKASPGSSPASELRLGVGSMAFRVAF